MVAPRCRCHHHHRPFRQQGERGRDLEADLGSSLAAGVSGPSRDRRWRSIGRAAATGKRRIEHRRRPRHRAGAGSGIAAGGLPAEPGRSGRATDSGALRFRGCDPHVRRRVPAGRGGILLRLPVDTRVRDAVEILTTNDSWYPAIDSDGDIRDGAWVAEATGLVEMSTWPAGTRLILRKERPHPGAQLRFTDSDGLRVTAFITDTAPGVVLGQLGGLELRHRQHARVEDRIREAKATGLRNLPCHRFEANAAWLEIILAATDLVAWTRLISFTEEPGLAKCEIGTFRYRVLHVAARITRGARQIRLRIDATWRWATAITQAWQQLRAAFP